MTKCLIVAGTFSNESPKASSVAASLSSGLSQVATVEVELLNGGSIIQLENAAESVRAYDAIVWMPNVSNELPKLVNQLKQTNPKAILVTSKNNTGKRDGIPYKQYTFTELVQRALRVHANLFIEIVTGQSGQYESALFDPLGNQYTTYLNDFTALGTSIGKQIVELRSMKRIGSQQIGPEKLFNFTDEYLTVVRDAANTFHTLISEPDVPIERFVGNTSFRCRHGFPSFMQNNMIYMSKRNMDKRDISSESFVALGKMTDKLLEYYGDKKPSVDAPIQYQLYDYYPNARYMLHGHVYVDGAPTTHKMVPCGDLREVEQVTALVPDRFSINFVVNLKGHGFIAIADDLEYLKELSFQPRPMPEYVGT